MEYGPVLCFFGQNDRVVHEVFGKGEVMDRFANTFMYPVTVRFLTGTVVRFSIEGRYMEGAPITLMKDTDFEPISFKHLHLMSEYVPI
jgi:hypothetical protein